MKEKTKDKIANITHIILTIISILGLIYSDEKITYTLFLCMVCFLWGFRYGNK